MGTRGTLIACFLAATAIARPAAGQQTTAMVTANARADTTAGAKLLGSARNWRMKNSADRERADLLRLLRSEPNHPQALLMLGQLEIRTGNLDAATKILTRLATAHPAHVATAELEEALRIAGADSRKLAAIQLLLRVGKFEEAAASMRLLFPNGPVGRELAMEYYRVIGTSPTGWDEAKHGLEKLVEKEPGDTQYQVVLALHLTHRPATRSAGMTSLAELAKRAGTDRQQVLDAWQRAVVAIERNADSIGFYLAYLEVDPKNVSVLDALAEAQRTEAALRPWKLRDQADALLSAGRAEEAVATLKTALELDPKNPWVRFDLSRLYHKRGSQQQGRELMDAGLVTAADDPDMLYAVALYVGILDEADAALSLLNRIPVAAQSPSMKSLAKKMQIVSRTQRAQSLARDGKRADALLAMARAETDIGEDAELINIVASAWIDLGDPSRGLAIMRDALTKQTAPATVARLLYAGLLNRAGQYEELAPLLDTLRSSGNLSGNELEDFRYLRASMAAHIADDRRNTGDFAGARAVLAPALEQDPENIDMLMALARVHVATRDLVQARAIYQRVLSRTPNQVGARLALARTINESGDKAAARREVETILTNASADDLDTRLAVADIFLDMNETAAARQIVDRFRSVAPANTRVLVAAGRIARTEGRIDEAIGFFRSARADEEIARLERMRKGAVVSAGVDYLGKSGTPGISNLRAVELPVEVRIAAGNIGETFFHVDPVGVSAGKLQFDDLYNLLQYGKLQALAPGGISNAPAQSARGTAIAVGYETDGVSIDIGSTPLGFPVTDIVGGLKLSRSLAAFSYSAEIARRPVTSSLLSYAGVSDPVSGEVWGGVRSIGATLRLGYERGRFDTFLDLGYYLLTGRNVANNRELALRTGFNWEFIQKGDTRLSAGLALTHWRYRENLRYYSFGHGGYYSPQSYYSLALPFRWTGRGERWSYLLRASVSVSSSNEKEMPYYPTDPSLQSLGNPVYTGGYGHGSGYSVGGALEYLIAPQLFGGARFGIDRSAYYTPNFASLYLRFAFDSHRGNVPFPPDPVKPYSRF